MLHRFCATRVVRCFVALELGLFSEVVMLVPPCVVVAWHKVIDSCTSVICWNGWRWLAASHCEVAVTSYWDALQVYLVVKLPKMGNSGKVDKLLFQ